MSRTRSIRSAGTRRIGIGFVAVLLLLGAVRSGGCEEPDAEEVARRKSELLFRLRVNVAIDRGARWLLNQQQSDGAFELEGNIQRGPFPESRHEFGETALALYTLAHCGLGADRPEIERTLGWLRKHYRSLMKGEFWPQASSYSLSLFVLGLHTLYATPGRKEEAVRPDRYGAVPASGERPCAYPAWVRAAIQEILDWLLAERSERGLFRYPGGLAPDGPAPRAPPRPGALNRGPDFMGPEDVSNTQYVLLALWAGTRCGYKVAPDIAQAIARRLMALQEADGPTRARQRDPQPPQDLRQEGERYAPHREVPPTPETDRVRGFGYTPGDVATGSMTTGGLSSLLTVKAILLEQDALPAPLRKELDQASWDALAWLTQNYDVRSNPPMGALWHYYYLYGLERACVIADKHWLGTHSWYREGAELLLSAQGDEGEWEPALAIAGFGGVGGVGPGGPVPYRTVLLDTCFALLFLKRAALTPRQPLLDPPPVVTPSSAGDGPARAR